jgi:hypothetical protein
VKPGKGPKGGRNMATETRRVQPARERGTRDIPEASHRSSRHQDTAVAPLEQVSHSMVMVKASR